MDSKSFVITFAQEILDSVNESIVISDEQRKQLEEISQLIYDYASGYPVLVTKICKYIDEDIKS